MGIPFLAVLDTVLVGELLRDILSDVVEDEFVAGVWGGWVRLGVPFMSRSWLM